MTNFAKYSLVGFFVLLLAQPGLLYKLTGIREDVSSDVAMEKIVLNPRLRPSFRKPDHPVPTYFRKRTKDGEFVDRLSKNYGAEISLPETEDLFVGQTGAMINVKLSLLMTYQMEGWLKYHGKEFSEHLIKIGSVITALKTIALDIILTIW